MEFRWTLKPQVSQEEIEKLSKAINVNPVLAEILIQRNITTFDDAKQFFRPQLSDLHDPFLFPDMQKAVDRLIFAIENNQKILIYGDYDVDGTTAVSLVYGFLSEFYPNLEYYIPDRYLEGYGVSSKGIDYAAENGFSLIISLDCGIKSVDKVAYSNSKNIDFIICDHHETGDELPAAVAILDAKRVDSVYPYNELSGCGVGFKLLQGFCIQKGISQDILCSYLDFVIISIAADIVPMNGENRTLAYFGLKQIENNIRPGLQALKKAAGVGEKLTTSQVVFALAPRINAAGRISDAKHIVKLLLAKTTQEAEELAEQLNKLNAERKNFDKTITADAISQIENNVEFLNAKSTVLYNESWHKGVIGIVASRCIEKHYKPTIILTKSNECAAGSARSVEGFDLYAALEQCSEHLIQFGGHKFAAGMTLEIAKIDDFRKKFDEVVSSLITEEMMMPSILIDKEVELKRINERFFAIINQFAPFGPQNMQPVFVSRKVKDSGAGRLLKDEHLKLVLTQDNDFKVDAIGFFMGHHFERIKKGDLFDVCYTVELNEYNGRISVQLMIKDIKFL